MNRESGEVDSDFEADGYRPAIAVSRDGEVPIGSPGRLILPSGDEVAIEGDVHNIDW